MERGEAPDEIDINDEGNNVTDTMRREGMVREVRALRTERRE